MNPFLSVLTTGLSIKLKEAERELARKDKALAEFAALVALKKSKRYHPPIF